MSDSMRNMASSWMLKNREPEFQEMAEYTKNFREKMLALETISDKIAKDRFGEKVHKFYLLFLRLTMRDCKSNFVFTLGCLCKCMQNKSRLAVILFVCCTNLLPFDARIWPHFHVKTHKSPLCNTQIGMLTALFNLWLLLLVILAITQVFPVLLEKGGGGRNQEKGVGTDLLSSLILCFHPISAGLP